MGSPQTHSLDVAEAVASRQGGSNADGSIHSKSILLQAREETANHSHVNFMLLFQKKLCEVTINLPSRYPQTPPSEEELLDLRGQRGASTRLTEPVNIVGCFSQFLFAGGFALQENGALEPGVGGFCTVYL